MLVLELYAIEIQMYSDLKETRKLKVSFRGRVSDHKANVTGDLQCLYESQECNSASKNYGRDPRMWWQNVDDGAYVPIL